MPRYDFRCARGHVHEDMVSRETRALPCVTCGDEAQREIGLPQLPGINGPARVPKSQSAVPIGEFQEAGQHLEDAHKRVENDVGHTLEAPNLWGAAKQGAADVLAGKRKPPDGWVPKDLTA